MSELRFRFNLDKFVNALAYFAARGVSDLTKLKAVKLLYFADQYHLHRYGRPIIGDRYVAMDLGPVPEDSYQLISRVLEPDEVVDEAQRKALESLEVYRGLFRQYKYPVLRARRKPDLDVFSDSEIEALGAITEQHGTTPARALVDLTHTHRAYRLADMGRSEGSSVFLPYEYFFEDAPEDLRQPAVERAESQQEDRDFADQLRYAATAAVAAREKFATAR
jgi:uncharacterized phage-associated protein